VKGLMPTHGGFLLDTNIVIGILEQDASITNRLDPSAQLFLPCIAMGELFYGAHNSGRVQHNLARLGKLSKSFPVLPCDLGTADTYGKLKTALRKKGRPIPDNDIWIAAIAEQQRLTLLTRDIHFQEFATLSVQVW